MAKRSDAARLEEVKTLLHQLQQIGSERKEHDGGPGQPHEGAKPGPSASRTKVGRPVLVTCIAMVLLAAATTSAWLLDSYRRESRDPPTAAIQQPGSPEPISSRREPTDKQPAAGAPLILLNQAQQMMLNGDILGARATLMKSADSGPPDVALALARSYDPSFLRSLSNPNAAPDIEQATLWYQRWYRAALENGQITDALKLERILRAMR
jgi:hypothetical protein